MGPETTTFNTDMRAALDNRDDLDFLAGGGQMEQRIRSHDWSRTPLGPLAKWPQSLKTALKIALNSRYPIWMGWGWDLINLYNDPYIPVLGKRDEWALGASAREVWKEIWEAHLGPQADGVLLRGEASWNDQRQLVMYRNGYAEETYFTFSFSPLPADEGGVGGLFCTCTEDTQKVLGERRLAALRHLAAETADARTESEACQVAARVLSERGGDVAFALIYLTDQDGVTATLAAATVPGAPPSWAPMTIPLDAGAGAGSAWPLGRCLAEGPQLVRDLSHLAGIPGGVWPEPAALAAVMPLARAGHDETRGFLVVGASPRLPFDPNYESFFELLARGVAGALSNARAYEEEKRRAEALAEIDRAKTAFFSNVSHEFRTPLTLMLGPVQEALAQGQLDGKLRDQLEVAHRNALRLQKLVNSLLDFARIEAGRAQASYEPVDLAALTTELASNFRSAMERAGLRFDVLCESLDEPWFVDTDMWEKIVLNLLSNAFKFTHAGGVEIRLHRDGASACLTVKDTGVGIPSAELPRLFERFHRVETTHGRTHEGSGIGLALVKELVRLHGGEIEVTSDLGRGSTFIVRVPAGTSHLPPERIKAARSLAPTSVGAESFVQEALRWLPGADEDQGAPPTHAAMTIADPRFAATFGARIVLADDNADMRSYVARLLKPFYRVEAVADGRAALDAIERERPALVLSDVMMPRLDGFALLQAVRTHPTLRAVPVVLLSARAGEDARIEGLDAGADDYLVKPFTARELLARVGALLELTQVRGAHDERMRLAIEGARIATWDWDLATNALYWSPTHFELLGYAPASDGFATYEMWKARLHPDDRQRVEESFNHALRTHSTYRCEYRVVRADNGATRWLAAYGTFIGERDEANRSVGIMLDVTDRHVAEEVLREADRRKDEFLAMLAHELRNPLAPIRNAVELLQRLPPGEPRATSVLDMAKRQVSQLTRLVDDLLDVSRVTQGRISLDRRPVELPGIIAEAVEAVEPLLREKHHRVSVQALPPLRVNADPTRLVQCVVNVLTNAAKYTDAGGEIRIQTRAEEGNAVVSVTDTGLGIAPELLPRIFDLFVQGHRTLDRSLGGLGVGLAIVKRLMQMHGGTVRVHSPGLGQGSTFELCMPITTDAPTVDVDELVEAGSPQRVLIVDDNMDAADTLKMLLELQGHDVHTLYSARQALEKAPLLKPDLVLLDIGLPEIDGYEVARQLRGHESLKRTRLIALSGYAQPEDRRRAHAAGFECHLVKPVELSALEPLLRRD